MRTLTLLYCRVLFVLGPANSCFFKQKKQICGFPDVIFTLDSAEVSGDSWEPSECAENTKHVNVRQST